MNPNSFTSISDTTKIAILCGNKNDISKFQKFVTPYSNKYEFYFLLVANDDEWLCKW